jgi:hypothetical protein
MEKMVEKMAEKTPQTKNLAQLLVKIAIGKICGW